MARNEADLFADLQFRLRRQAQHTVFVRSPDKFHTRQTRDQGHPGINGQCFQSGVNDRALGNRVAHDRRQYEQALLEVAQRFAVLVEVTVVVGIHEYVGAGLDLIVDAAAGLVQIRPGAGTGDDFWLDTMFVQHLHGHAHLLHSLGDRIAPFRRGTRVLRGPLVGLQAGEAQVLRCGDPLCQFDHRLSRIDAAAVRSDIDLDEYVEGRAGGVRRRVEVGDVLRIVYADAHPGAFPQCRQA